MVSELEIHTALDAQGIHHAEISHYGDYHNIAYTDGSMVFCKVVRPEFDNKLANLELSLAGQYGSNVMLTPLHPTTLPVGDTYMSVWRWEPLTTFDAETISPEDSVSAAEALSEIHALPLSESPVAAMDDLDTFVYNIEQRIEFGNLHGASMKGLRTLSLLSTKFMERQNVSFDSKLVLNHGDTHIGNLVRRGDSERLSWLDFEGSKIAPRELDIATLRVNLDIIGGNHEAWKAAKKSFGQFDEIDEELLDILTRVRLISVTAYGLLRPSEYDLFEQRISILESMLDTTEIPKSIPKDATPFTH